MRATIPTNKMQNLIQIENKHGKTSLTESVNPASISRMIEEMEKVFSATAAAAGTVTGEITAFAENGADTLDIEIHSPGGSVFDGYRVYHAIQAMRQRGVYVTAKINSLAASMASVIAMAADKIQMVSGGRMMIHDASQGVFGNAEEHAKAALILDEISAEIAGVYSKRTGTAADEIRAMMKTETWMGATEAKSKNFIDEILTGNAAQNNLAVAPGDGNPADMSLLNRLLSPSDTEAKDRITALEAQIAQHDGELAKIQAELETAESTLVEAHATATANLELMAKVTAFEIVLAGKDAEIVTLTDAAEFTTAKVDSHAAQKLAAMGHGEPLDLGTPAVTASDSKNLMDKYEALSGIEKRDFLAKHGVELQAFAKTNKI